MKLVDSPLFEPVLWEGRGFKILDETLIPERIEYIGIDQVAQAIDAVREMKTRAFGQVLTFFYSGALLAREYHGDDPASLQDQLTQYESAVLRRTADIRFQCSGRFLLQVDCCFASRDARW